VIRPAILSSWLLLILGVMASPAVAGTVTSLSVQSDPGEWIGQGETLSTSAAQATFNAWLNDSPGRPAAGQNVILQVTSSGRYWYLRFQAPDGELLVPGIYQNARTAGAAGQPGLNISADSRGCESNGTFVVKEASYGPDLQVVAFRATFTQYCASSSAALRGEIRYNATVPFEFSAPAAVVVPVGQAVTFSVTATGTHGQAVAIAANGLPAGAEFADHGDNAATFFWVPAASQTGVFPIAFTGQDEGGATESAITLVTVAPLNDALESAQTILGVPDGGSLEASNDGATVQIGEPPYTRGGRSVWFRFTASRTGRMAIEARSSEIDTTIAVFTDNSPDTPPSFPDLPNVASNDNAYESTTDSRLVFHAEAGQVYYVSVDSASGATGTFTLTWRRAEVARMLWRHTSGAITVWTVDEAGVIVDHPIFGPFPGWTVLKIAVGPDRKTRVLWRHTTGMVNLWTIDGHTILAYSVFGPYEGWTAADMAIGSDGRIHVAWTHTTDVLGLWTLTPDGTTLMSTAVQGPVSQHVPVGLAVDSASTVRTLWRSSTGRFSLFTGAGIYGPANLRSYQHAANVSVLDLSAGAWDFASRVLWTSTTGLSGFWRQSPYGGLDGRSYGPYPGWTPVAIAERTKAGDQTNLETRLLWRHAEGSIALWTVGVSGAPVSSVLNYGPFEGWAVLDLAVGPE
jgi:hypothetical protein